MGLPSCALALFGALLLEKAQAKPVLSHLCMGAAGSWATGSGANLAYKANARCSTLTVCNSHVCQRVRDAATAVDCLVGGLCEDGLCAAGSLGSHCTSSGTCLRKQGVMHKPVSPRWTPLLFCSLVNCLATLLWHIKCADIGHCVHIGPTDHLICSTFTSPHQHLCAGTPSVNFSMPLE